MESCPSKIELDKFPELTQQLQVRTVQTLFGLYQGKTVGVYTGGSQQQLQQFLEAVYSCVTIESLEESIKVGLKAIENNQIQVATTLFSKLSENEKF